MTTAHPQALESLRDLLQQNPREPRRHAAELRAARRAASGGGELARELLLAECRWALRAASGHPELAAAVAETATAMREFHVRCVLSGPASDAEALLELAEFEGERRAAGDDEAATAAAREIGRRLGSVDDAERIAQEADERFAAQTAIDDGRSLREQVEVLAATGRTLLAVGQRLGERRIVRRGHRSLRAGRDRELVLRLEGLLGRRGVVAMETTSFVLLLIVLVVLAVEALATLAPEQLVPLYWIDGIACLWFVAEFTLKCVLAPHRGSWFLRNVATDLLPAIPAVLFLLPGPSLPAAADDAVVVRLLRLFRITWAARYVQAMRPLLRLFRLLLIVVRGMDGLVRRFGPLLDRNFVFFENVGRESVAEAERRDLAHAALQQEQMLCAALPGPERVAELRIRLAGLAQAASVQCAVWPIRSVNALGRRDIPVDEAAEFLWGLQPSEVPNLLGASDVRALDRVVRVLHARPLCWLPILRRFAVHPLPPSPEERVVALGRRVAEWLQGWQHKLQFVADLHGIVTGPQILDRVATAMVKASQRPAVRLLLFGALFLIVDLVIQNESLSRGLQRIVVGPLLILGSFCLVTLTLGWWLKRVAGEASDTFRMTSEASYLSLLELAKRRFEAVDVRFLAHRVFGRTMDADAAEGLLREHLTVARAGVPLRHDGIDPVLRQEANRTALLYLHFLDGAILHESDVTSTEQLLANSSLENLRLAQLRLSRKERKKLKQLRLDDGSIFRGPFLWFRFITESVAVETAKRITEYNRRCIPIAARPRTSAEDLAALDAWLQKRCDPKAGRMLERLPPPDSGAVYVTTEFNALDFLAADAERDEHIREMFGETVLAALQSDRRNMIREIFGMRPVHVLPRHHRSFNAWRFYWSRLSHGRVLLAPVYSLWRMLRSFAWFVARIRQIVREVVTPHLELQQREPGEAPFAVALRKIHRMKAPQLLEAMRLRIQLDPTYCGAAPGWSEMPPPGERPQFERDCDFLHLRERERAELRRIAAENRERVQLLHALLPLLPTLVPAEGCEGVAPVDGELAVTIAWMCDRDDARTLLLAESWRADLAAESGQPTVGRWRRLGCRLRDAFARHPVDAWADQHARELSTQARHLLRRRYATDATVRRTIDAWRGLPAGASPASEGMQRLRRAYREGSEIRREIAALRAIQSLTVLDVRNYRDLVFRLGDYAAEGEDPRLATELP